MKKLVIAALGAGAMAVTALGLAGTAAAAGGADTTVNGLTSEGYLVRLNGPQSANLTACTVINVEKSGGEGPSPSALVDIACPDGC